MRKGLDMARSNPEANCAPLVRNAVVVICVLIFVIVMLGFAFEKIDPKLWWLIFPAFGSLLLGLLLVGGRVGDSLGLLLAFRGPMGAGRIDAQKNGIALRDSRS